MESEKIRAFITINGDKYPLKVLPEDEPYFRLAEEMINDKLGSLKSNYSAKASAEKLVGLIAIEAMVDALKVNEKYLALRDVLKSRLETIDNRFE